ncbi:unnamed protein product [Rotaria magnacalcarata]|uniref:Uncharacterized protein n=1 Tax=Rotaria magnacalcarata TaxID=392030 RepID=A0A816VW21_9BILA|nr:unnamed protein product [Rotaria magnacalcarata]CAF3927263.1 unnamed protein product [Rotaria magnacalcarata]
MSEDLSLNDVVMPICYTRISFVFDYKIDDLEKPLFEFLKRFCPSVFGKIVYDENKPNYGQLVESTSNSSRIFSRADQPDIPISNYINCSFQELDVHPYSAIPTDSTPLFFLHQINVRDGTLLAVGMHHQLSDGRGFFTLVERFSNWIRYKDDTKIIPFNFDRSLLKPATDVLYEHTEYTTQARKYSFTELPTMEVIVKKFTKQELFDKLKITATHVSFNDVLVAWLTQAISQIRQIPSDETIKVGIANDGRSELGIGLDYFGNCNFYFALQFQMIDLLNKSVNELAEQVNNDKKKRMTKDYMTSALAWLKQASEPVHPSFKAFLGKDLAFTNWSRFPLYQIDFGHGPPRRVALPPNRWDGMILILPTETDAVELYIGLKQDHADELLQRIDAL